MTALYSCSDTCGPWVGVHQTNIGSCLSERPQREWYGIRHHLTGFTIGDLYELYRPEVHAHPKILLIAPLVGLNELIQAQ